MSANPTYDTGGGGSPTGGVDCPSGQSTPIVSANQERVMLAVCVPTGETVLLQPANANNLLIGFCVANGETFRMDADKWGSFVALDWNIVNTTGHSVKVTVAQLLLPGWLYPTTAYGYTKDKEPCVTDQTVEQSA
jgi:hypothetical protein